MREAVQLTHRASSTAQADAESGAARAINLALGQGRRSIEARAALDALDAFRPRPLRRGEAIGLGAVVELELEDDQSGRTVFLAPVGAGQELTGPDGDGVFQVVTPVSPLGKALMGRRVGEVIEVMLQGEVTEWKITFAS